LSISERDLADLDLGGLHSYFKEKLEGYDYFSINQLQIRSSNQEYKFKNAKETYKTHRSNTYVVEYESDTSDNEEKEVCAAEFVWPSKAKSCSCPLLNLSQKNRQEE